MTILARTAFRRTAVFALALGLLTALPSFALQQDVFTNDRGEPECFFSGDIAPPVLPKFVQNMKSGCELLVLMSDGGDVETALAMGRVIRNSKVSVAVLNAGRCASACVFLYAAGVMRIPYGPVVIHRPYLGASSASYSATQQKYAAIEQRIRRYLREMNVSESLFARMMEVPPEDSRTLTMKEMDQLGMGASDPVYDEYMENQRAAKAGIPKRVWLTQKLKARQACGEVSGIISAEEVPHMDKRLACWRRVFPAFLDNRN